MAVSQMRWKYVFSLIHHALRIDCHKIGVSSLNLFSSTSTTTSSPCRLRRVDTQIPVPIERATPPPPPIVATRLDPAPAPTDGGPSPSSTGGGAHVVVVGSGPSGLFAALTLAEAGVRTTLVERGQPVELRGRSIGALFARKVLDPESNLCYGEGGAGTWSDGTPCTCPKTICPLESLPFCVPFTQPHLLASPPAPACEQGSSQRASDATAGKSGACSRLWWRLARRNRSWWMGSPIWAPTGSCSCCARSEATSRRWGSLSGELAPAVHPLRPVCASRERWSFSSQL